MTAEKRLIVVSNRLPVSVVQDDAGLRLEHSSGGLVTALCPVLMQHCGHWIGWTGTARTEQIDRLFGEHACNDYELIPVFLTSEEKANFYFGFSNEILWPLFHDLQSRCNFDPAYWRSYTRVNEKYADAVLDLAGPDDFIWVQDYHLMLVANSLRKRQMQWSLAYFHHIPFPAPDIFEKLPWRSEILHGLLRYSLLGFQTKRDRRNFVSCVRQFVPDAEISRVGDRTSIRLGPDCTLLGDFPIGIDYDEFAAGAQQPLVVERASQIRKDVSGSKIILGVDRLDYTKGIPERLRAFRSLLESDEAVRGTITLIQIVVPSRMDIPRYQDLRLDIERLVSSINGRFGHPGWVPIHYIHRSLDRQELLAYYRAADVALITPLKDGMNLVCKEYCAAQIDEQGVLILSEFAGAASQLHDGALLVNPNDVEGVGQTIRTALAMPPEEHRRRMRHLRSVAQHDDVYRWSRRFFFEGRNFPVRPSGIKPLQESLVRCRHWGRSGEEREGRRMWLPQQ